MNNRNLPGSMIKALLARKADNLIATCEPTVQKMCEARNSTTLWAPTACNMDGFIFYFYTLIIIMIIAKNAVFVSYIFPTKTMGN
jgi:hypothetical protein